MEIKVVLTDFQPEIAKIAESVGIPTMQSIFPHLMSALNKGALLNTGVVAKICNRDTNSRSKRTNHKQ